MSETLSRAIRHPVTWAVASFLTVLSYVVGLFGMAVPVWEFVVSTNGIWSTGIILFGSVVLPRIGYPGLSDPVVLVGAVAAIVALAYKFGKKTKAFLQRKT